jgi:tetratricopeptide (TPR) repeat protein
VSGTSDAIRAAVQAATTMPHGRARVAELEAVLVAAASGADGGPDAAAAVRLALIPSCLLGGEHQRVADHLAALLRQDDEGRLAAAQRPAVRSAFRFATTGLLQHPDIPLARIEALVDDLARRLAAAGLPPTAALRARYDLARHRRGPSGADREFRAWAGSLPAGFLAATGSPGTGEDAGPHAADPDAGTPLSCPWCARATAADHLARTERHAEAVETVLPVLDTPPGVGCPGCTSQPVAAIGAVLPSLLLTGRFRRAAAEHLRAVDLLRRDDADDAPAPPPDTGTPLDAAARADQVLVCARTGRLERGLDLLTGWLGWYAEAGPPYARMQMAAAAARLLRALAESGHGGLVLHTPGEPTTVDELGARLLREARDLAGRFDVRNGTGTASDLVDETLDAGTLPDLPLDAVLRAPRPAGLDPRRDGSRGRRTARSGVDDPAAVAAGANLVTMAESFDAALAADSACSRSMVLKVWRQIRGGHTAPAEPACAVAAARLEAWSTVERLQAGPDEPDDGTAADALAAAVAAAGRLAGVGLPVEALLHEQAALLAAAQTGRVRPDAVYARIEHLALETAETGSVAERGLAFSRLVLIRELAPAAAGPPDPRTDPLELGLAALESVPVEDLRHQHRRALCRLLRLRAADQPPGEAMETLRRGIDVLPDGVRPLERALARADLAGLLQAVDPPAALEVWQDAVADAAAAGAEAVLGNLLAAGAGVRQTLGDIDGAVTDLVAAVPLLDRYAEPELAAQARFDLSRALLDSGRVFEATGAADSALADLTELLAGRAGIAPQALTEPDIDVLATTGPAVAHLTGCAAFSAGEAAAATGDLDRGRRLAGLSARWHQATGNLVAQAEAWQLAARITDDLDLVVADLLRAADLAEAGGDWVRAATCRRELATAIRETQGLEAALAVLDDAEKALATRQDAPGGRHAGPDAARAAERRLAWHRIALSEQRARMLAVAGRFREALVEIEGLDSGYTELGDDWSARDLRGLRGQLRAELDDLPGALDDLELAAVEAVEAGDRAQAHGLGERLAVVLDEAGRPEQAEQAWERFCLA